MPGRSRLRARLFVLTCSSRLPRVPPARGHLGRVRWWRSPTWCRSGRLRCGRPAPFCAAALPAPAQEQEGEMGWLVPRERMLARENIFVRSNCALPGCWGTSGLRKGFCSVGKFRWRRSRRDSIARWPLCLLSKSNFSKRTHGSSQDSSSPFVHFLFIIYFIDLRSQQTRSEEEFLKSEVSRDCPLLPPSPFITRTRRIFSSFLQ